MTLRFACVFYSIQEFDMIGLFGTPAGRSLTNNNTTTITTASSKIKSKATTNTLLENQINDKLKETNNNLIKKRPNFLKFFNDSFMKTSSDDASSESSCKRWVLALKWRKRRDEERVKERKTIELEREKL